VLVDDQMLPPARFLDIAATYNTTLTAPFDAVQLPLLAQLAERSPRRHTRSPGEAGGGRSDLCHDNDEPDPVNRRARVGDNSFDPPTELLACGRGLVELVILWLPPGYEQLPSHLEERKTEFGDNGEGRERSRRCDIE
jgi:hypothetical protein